MRTDQFQYELPPGLIAQTPAAERDASRLLVLDRRSGERRHLSFRDFPGLPEPGDLLVLNNSKVFPARLRAVKPGTGGAVEVLLAGQQGPNDWQVLLRPGKRVRAGTRLRFLDRSGSESPVMAEVVEKAPDGSCRLIFQGTPDILEAAWNLGEIPLPPYIARPEGVTPGDSERYQTVFAGPAGSVAAPTAGLHFTPEILARIRARGVRTAEVTLHVGLGTFAPVKAVRLEDHRMHAERFTVSPETAAAVQAAKAGGRRVIAAGTTSLRVLESAADGSGRLRAGAGETSLFIYPPRAFALADALLTNFHLPESTLLMLVSAFAAPGSTAGRELILETYAEAVRERYRFFSYGDAMLIL